jgi:midasin (ATPase involved in ribosome maturation)
MLFGRHLHRICVSNQTSLVSLADSILVVTEQSGKRYWEASKQTGHQGKGHTVMMEVSEGGASSQAVKSAQ